MTSQNGAPSQEPDKFYRNVNLQSCMDAGLKVDASTIGWWMMQNEEAKAALRDPPPTLLSESLEGFARWLDAVRSGLKSVEGGAPPDLHIWAHATFDLPILDSAFRACGRKAPWRYWNCRDVRTIHDLAFPDQKEVPGRPTTRAHNALWDAWRQAIEVQICWRKINNE